MKKGFDMVTEHRANEQPPVRSTAFKVTTLILALASLVAVTGAMVHWLRPTEETATQAKADGIPPRLFRDWPKLDLALVVSGQQNGYLLPCGCSRPQKGGLERRYNFVQLLKTRGWPVAEVDLGDVPQLEGPQKLPNKQGLLKYQYSMKALKEIGYAAVGVGPNELAMPLEKTVGEWALNEPSPRLLSANFKNDGVFPPDVIPASEIATAAGSNIKVGVASLVSPSTAKENKDPGVKFDDEKKVLPGVLAALKAKNADIVTLLYSGTKEEATELAKAFPEVQVIVCLCAEDDPPAKEFIVGKTIVIQVGKKGKFIGVLGMKRAAEKVQLYYEMVELGEEYLTPPAAQAGHPIAALIQKYANQVKKDDYLKQFANAKGFHDIQMKMEYAKATYVGSDKCKSCHKNANDVWESSKHSHAYQSLVDATRPKERQYDGECGVCHVVGLAYKGGFISETKTPNLKNVGCENCHGPGSLHIENQRTGVEEDGLQAMMNPWKAKKGEDEKGRAQRRLRINDFCRHCHDDDNDVHWDFDKKWPEIDHPAKKQK